MKFTKLALPLLLFLFLIPVPVTPVEPAKIQPSYLPARAFNVIVDKDLKVYNCVFMAVHENEQTADLYKFYDHNKRVYSGFIKKIKLVDIERLERSWGDWGNSVKLRNAHLKVLYRWN